MKEDIWGGTSALAKESVKHYQEPRQLFSIGFSRNIPCYSPQAHYRNPRISLIPCSIVYLQRLIPLPLTTIIMLKDRRFAKGTGTPA